MTNSILRFLTEESTKPRLAKFSEIAIARLRSCSALEFVRDMDVATGWVNSPQIDSHVTYRQYATPPNNMNGAFMRIAYLIPEFPSQTHIFFWRERTALRKIDIATYLVSTRRPPKAVISHD